MKNTEKKDHPWKRKETKRKKFSNFNPDRRYIAGALEIFLAQGGQIVQQEADYKNAARLKMNRFEDIVEKL